MGFYLGQSSMPNVVMTLNGKDKAFIPVGKMLNAMEEMIDCRVEFCETKSKTRLYMTFSKDHQKAYIEERDYLNQFVCRYTAQWQLWRFKELYLSIITLFRNCSEMYYDVYKVYSIKVNNMAEESYIATTIENAFSQFIGVHPYLIDDIGQCNIHLLTNDEIEKICEEKIIKLEKLLEG